MPKLSVILIYYKMEQQIGNTLRSLLPPYQRSIKLADYEILLIDNGSPKPLPESVWKLKKNILYTRIPPHEASPNPGVAINHAVAQARGEVVSIMIDGARMVTPGVLAWGSRLCGLEERAMVEVRGWHLGPKFQPDSILEGYNHKVETQLLNKVKWWENGYRLFHIAAPSAQSRHGFSGPTGESNCLFLRHALFQEIGGYDERFAAPGGGWVNLDFFARAVDSANTVFTLLGEGTFHQVHGGAATGLTREQLRSAQQSWSAETAQLRGELPAINGKKFVLAGHLPPECAGWLSTNNQ